jgi:hypothetical protein
LDDGADSIGQPGKLRSSGSDLVQNPTATILSGC